jgi:N12 class adenine-specific DNA methylase
MSLQFLQNEVSAHIGSSLKTYARANIAAIELLKEIQSSGRTSDDTDSLVLAKFVGMGGLKYLFEETNEEWQPLHQQLVSVTTTEEYEALRGSILNAHYTHPDVVQALWLMVKQMGFAGGKILAPSFGMGYFHLFAPDSVNDKSEWTAIELDSITASLTKLIYPQVNIFNSGFEHVALPESHYDLVIDNFPFGDYKVSDQLYPEFSHLYIHNFFFAKSMRLLRPGGLMAVITSSGTMGSASNQGFREHLRSQANLIAAFRLPSNTFKAFNTEVTTDVLLFQKLDPDNGVEPDEFDWTPVVRSYRYSYRSNDYLKVPSYYEEYPDRYLGRQTEDTLWPGRLACEAYPDQDTIGLLRDAAADLPFVYRPAVATDNSATAINGGEEYLSPIPEELQNTKLFSFFGYNGILCQRLERSIKIVKGNNAKRIWAMMRIASWLEEVLEAQRDSNDQVLAEAQAELRKAYDQFVEEFGNLRSKTNWDAFCQDGRIYLLQALEVEIKDGRKITYKQADIFFKRTARPNIIPNVATPKDALMVCLNQLGKFDANHAAGLLAIPVTQLIDELVAEDAIFCDPITTAYVVADEYLSGNVVEKLTIAREHSIQRNIDALEKVQPLFLLPPGSPDIKADVANALGGEEKCDLDPGATIQARLGSPWIDTEYIRGFIAFLIECNVRSVTVKHAIGNNNWSVDLSSYEKWNTKNTSVYGTADFTACELVEHCLNSKEIVVKDKVELPDGATKQVKNAAKSQAAQAKAKQIKEVFKTWLWNERTRALQLTIEYNRRFNQTVERKYDGSHLTFPGMAPNFSLRNSQKGGVWQVLCNPSTLIAHCVGAGKTALSIAAVMEMKRLGIVAKPMICVLNATLPQFEAEFRRLYPAAKLLVPTSDDFKKHNRRRLVATIATWDWDCIIISASQFTTIQLSRETQLNYLSIEMDAVNDDLAAFGKDRKSFVTKALERKRKGLVKKIEELRNAKLEEGSVSWEQLGIDCLVVDEFHLRFKKPGISTKMAGVAGIDTSQSARGLDMFMKVRQLRKQNGRLVFMTGTPITNSVGELYTIQRYLQLEELQKAGIAGFDAWAMNFGEIVTAPEISPTGKYQVKSRFSKFTNVPKLIGMYRMIANVVDQSALRKPDNWADLCRDMGEDERMEAEKLFIQLPTHTLVSVAAKPSPDQRAYMQILLERSEKIKAGDVDPTEDNMFVVTGDGRKSCIDMRLVSRIASNYLDSKINEAAVNVFRIWQATKELKLTQSIFCDFSTPKDGKVFDVYTYLRDLLVEMGVPKEEIKFAHKFATSEAKLKFYDEFNRGDRRIFITSTEKGATGTNIQRRLVAVHHIDAPWRPADIEQRDGRILRVHNLCPHVLIFRYVTEGTNDLCGFDSFLWQGLETKARYIEQIMKASSGQHTVEDIGGTALTYAELKALASGDPRIMRKAEVDQKVQELALTLKGVEGQLTIAKMGVGSLPKTIDRYTAQLQRYESDFDLIKIWDGYDGVAKLDKDDKQADKSDEVNPPEDVDAELDSDIESDSDEVDDNIQVKKPKAKKDTRVKYKPMFYPFTIYQGRDEIVISADVRQVGELILAEVNAVQENRLTGRHQIGFIPLRCDIKSKKEDGFKIVAEFRPANNYTTLFLSRKGDYQVNLVSNAVQNIRGIFTTCAKVQQALHDLRGTLTQSKNKFKNLSPQIETLEADARKYREELEPLLQEQIELDTLLNITVGEAQIGQGGEGGGASDSDDDEESGVTAFFERSSQLAPYMGIEPEIVEALLEKANGDAPDWLDELHEKTIRPMNPILSALESLLAIEIEEPVVQELQADEPVVDVVVEPELEPVAVILEEVVDVTPDSEPEPITASAFDSDEPSGWDTQFNDVVIPVSRKAKAAGSDQQVSLFDLL